MNALNQFEIRILDWIQQGLKCDFLDFFMPIITRFADSGMGWIVLALVLLCFKKTRKTGVSMAVALIFGLVVGNLVLKNVFARIRPYNVNTDVLLLIERLSDFSFPSGHTRCSFECATVIFANSKRWGAATYVFASLVAFSRLYLYVHYPTDILGGIALGIVSGIISVFIVKKADEYFQNRKLKKA